MRERRKDKRYEIEGAAVACSGWTAIGWLLSKLTGARTGQWLHMTNLCSGGVSFTTSMPPKHTSAVLLRILFLDEKRPYVVKGVLQWVKQQCDGEARVLRRREYKAFGVGVSFDALPRALAQAIEEHRVAERVALSGLTSDRGNHLAPP